MACKSPQICHCYVFFFVVRIIIIIQGFASASFSLQKLLAFLRICFRFSIKKIWLWKHGDEQKDEALSLHELPSPAIEARRWSALRTQANAFGHH
jgi:hypothetical protein